MQEIHTLTGHGLEYFSLEELKALLSSRFEILYAEEEIVSLPFGTPLEVLQHLRQTGVTGTERESGRADACKVSARNISGCTARTTVVFR